MKCAVPGHFSGALFKGKTKHFLSFYFYTFLITMTDFCKVPYFEDLESQENMKVKRSTTSIKTQGDLHPREVVISVLTYSSVKIFGDHTGE
jgi:hypothetical protein